MGPEVKTLLLAMTPVNELRGTIPLAIGIYHLPLLSALFWAILGNILPIFLLLWLWPKITLLVRVWRPAEKALDWFLERTRQRFYKKYSLYGDLALLVFVAVPLPLTGAWTGSIAAFLFGISYWRAIGLIFLGVLIAGLIVTGLTTGVFTFFHL